MPKFHHLYALYNDVIFSGNLRLLMIFKGYYYYFGSYLNGYCKFCTPHMTEIRSINSLKSFLYSHVSLLHCHMLSLLHCRSRVIVIALSRVIVIALTELD